MEYFVGGCPGVALFFTISGFLLVRGIEKQHFFTWWIKKVVRVYIPLTIVNIITVLIGFRSLSIQLFLFPVNVNLWYVPVISILYVLYYLVVKSEKSTDKPVKMVRGGYRRLSILLTLLIYVFLYLMRFRNEFFVEPEVGFRVLYGFMAMMIGGLVYDRRDEVSQSEYGKLFLAGSILCCTGFLGTKLLINRVSIVMKLQFITQAFGVGFAVLALLTGLCYERKIKDFMESWGGKAVGIVSKCSLEIYLVQFAIIYYLKALVFPVNFVLILITILVFAYMVHFISGKIYSIFFPMGKS